MRFNPEKFDHQVDEAIKKARQKLKSVVVKAADYSIRQLTSLSPVWSGSYVMSHRVGIDSRNDAAPTNMTPGLAPGEIPIKVIPSVALKFRKEAYMRAKARFVGKELPDKGRIILYNNAPHAGVVEVLPDKYLSGKMSPYHPYGKTKQRLSQQIYKIIKEAK